MRVLVRTFCAPRAARHPTCEVTLPSPDGPRRLVAHQTWRCIFLAPEMMYLPAGDTPLDILVASLCDVFSPKDDATALRPLETIIETGLGTWRAAVAPGSIRSVPVPTGLPLHADHTIDLVLGFDAPPFMVLDEDPACVSRMDQRDLTVAEDHAPIDSRDHGIHLPVFVRNGTLPDDGQPSAEQMSCGALLTGYLEGLWEMHDGCAPRDAMSPAHTTALAVIAHRQGVRFGLRPRFDAPRFAQLETRSVRDALLGNGALWNDRCWCPRSLRPGPRSAEARTAVATAPDARAAGHALAREIGRTDPVLIEQALEDFLRGVGEDPTQYTLGTPRRAMSAHEELSIATEAARLAHLAGSAPPDA